MKETQRYIEKASPLACSSNKKAMKMFAEICSRIAGETNSAKDFDIYGEQIDYRHADEIRESLSGIY